MLGVWLASKNKTKKMKKKKKGLDSCCITIHLCYLLYLSLYITVNTSVIQTTPFLLCIATHDDRKLKLSVKCGNK